MILVDTSVWIDHLDRHPDQVLADLLARERVVMHRFVYGEIALGSPKDRLARLSYLRNLHHVATASDGEVLWMIESLHLHGAGIGYTDAHLLAAALASPPARKVKLWTRDKRLHAQADRLGVAAGLA